MMRHLLILLAALCLHSAAAQQIDPTELDLEDNISLPAVPKKAAPDIRAHMENIRRTLVKHNLDARLMRDGEVLLVTIPCSDLFSPNSIELKHSGEKFLRPFASLLRYPTMYKLLIAVHSDDTGEVTYLDDLTAARANAIDDFLCTESSTKGSSLIPYGMGLDDPLCENNSIVNRARNRRVEIYIVPEWQMIDTARSGKLK